VIAEIERDADGRALRLVGAHIDVTVGRSSQHLSSPIHSAHSCRSRAPIPWQVPAQLKASVITLGLSPNTGSDQMRSGRTAGESSHPAIG
jgi:hypothetical protein